MPAERASWPPAPFFSSTLCTIVPTGMLPSGIALPGLMSTLLAGDDLVAGLQALRRQDVGELAVGVLDQRDEGGPVGIVLETLDRRRHVELATLEIDDAQAALVTAAHVVAGDAAVVVAAAGVALAAGQRLDRLALPEARRDRR